MKNIYCINPEETLSEGQFEELNRIQEKYPHLNDDEFIKQNIDEWKANIQ